MAHNDVGRKVWNRLVLAATLPPKFNIYLSEKCMASYAMRNCMKNSFFAYLPLNGCASDSACDSNQEIAPVCQ